MKGGERAIKIKNAQKFDDVSDLLEKVKEPRRKERSSFFLEADCQLTIPPQQLQLYESETAKEDGQDPFESFFGFDGNFSVVRKAELHCARV